MAARVRFGKHIVCVGIVDTMQAIAFIESVSGKVGSIGILQQSSEIGKTFPAPSRLGRIIFGRTFQMIFVKILLDEFLAFADFQRNSQSNHFP